MKLLLLVLALTAVVAVECRRHRRTTPEEEYPLFHSIQSCKDLKAEGESVPNCPNLGPCLKTVYGKVVACHKSQDQKHKDCEAQEANTAAKKEWLDAGCKYHNAVRQCMDGTKEPTGDFATILATAGEVTAHTGAHEEHQPPPGCWSDILKELKECLMSNAECPNIKVCGGKEPAPAGADEKLVKWNKITHQLKKTKKLEMKEFLEKMKTCIAA